MVWIDSVELLAPIATDSSVIDLISIKHTPLIALLTSTSIYILNEHSLLPLAVHSRTPDSIEQHGLNKTVKIKQLSLGIKLSKLNFVNLFVVTDHDYLIIYQVNVDPTKSVYELNDDNDVLLQKLLPVSTNSHKNGLLQVFNQVTKRLGLDHINLENIESFNNPADDFLDANIEHVKLSVFRTIKIGIGITKFWLKSNSHNLFIYNENLIQIINIKTLNNEIFNFIEFDWFDSKSKDLWYNYTFNYFILQDSLDDLWYVKVDDNELNPEGHKLNINLQIDELIFNPVYQLLLIKHNKDGVPYLSLYKFELGLSKCTDIDMFGWSNCSVQWSQDGEFFFVVGENGHWFISSKFGNVTSNTEVLSQEINENYLHAQKLLVSSNDRFVLLFSEDLIRKVNLVKLTNQQDLILSSPHYFSVVESNKFRNKLIKFPLLPHLKMIDFLSPDKFKLKISKNAHDQFIISYGDKLSISNPYRSSNADYNHLVWFNFKNYYMETLNIINHITFNLFLILINRTTSDAGSKDHLLDELVVLNVEDSKFAQGGEQFPFDSDLFIWRHKLDVILTFEMVDNKLIILDTNYKLFVYEMFDGYTNNEGVHYRFFMRLKQTIDFTTMKDRISLDKICKIQLIDKLNFLILLNDGGFYILKSQSNKILLTSYYQLIQIQDCIENFRINDISINEELIKYIYLFKGNQLLIYNLTHLIDLVFDPGDLNPQDGLDDEDINHQMRLIKPIIIDLESFQPLKIHKTEASINLIGVQDLLLNKHFVKVKLNSRLILNNLIEFDLVNGIDIDIVHTKFVGFNQYNYCLELLLFDYLTHDNKLIHPLIDLIKLVVDYEPIFINCLRKIEFKYWSNFFDTLKTTPMDLMNKLLDSNRVQLGYNFLIIYLNLKSEEEESKASGYLDSNDEEIILKLIQQLVKLNYWDWCFELCRFIKLLDPSSKILKRVKEIIDKTK